MKYLGSSDFLSHQASHFAIYIKKDHSFINKKQTLKKIYPAHNVVSMTSITSRKRWIDVQKMFCINGNGTLTILSQIFPQNCYNNIANFVF